VPIRLPTLLRFPRVHDQAGRMGRISHLALLSAVNPTLVASVTVMMLLSNPMWLTLSYLAVR
jgi:hypothetical protein